MAERKPIPRIQKFPLRLETMERRDVPSADLVWTAGGDGVHWSDASNWEEFNNGALSGVHRTPTSGDTLWFGELGGPMFPLWMTSM
jgi:hypothetical protein